MAYYGVLMFVRQGLSAVPKTLVEIGCSFLLSLSTSMAFWINIQRDTYQKKIKLLLDCKPFTLSPESAAHVCLVAYTKILFSPLLFISLSLSGNCKSQKMAFVIMPLRFRVLKQSHYQFTSPVGNWRLFSTSGTRAGACNVQPKGQLRPAESHNVGSSCPLPVTEGWGRNSRTAGWCC